MLRDAMPSDPRSHARAAVLAGALVATPLPDAELVRRIEVPPIKLVVRRRRAPLDLDAAIYRYRVALDGGVSVVDEPVGARSCRRKHR
jgi:hypothetical protein